MAEIGALRASLSANSAAFERDMGRARNAVRKNAKGMESAMSRVRKGFGAAMGAVKVFAVAAAAAGGAMAAMIKGQINAADQARKTAQSVGVATETLTAWNHAADLSGVSQQNLANAFKVTAQRANDAARGSGEAVRAYDALGISVTDASGKLKDSDQLMLEVADRFSKMEDGAGKTALAVQLFGRSGADLIPMLNQGRDGIEQMTAEARALGIVLDDETAAGAERFNDNLTRLNAVKRGFVMQMMNAVLPTLEGYTDRMVDAAKETEGLDKASRVASSGLKILLSAGTLIKLAFDAIGTAIGGVAASLVSLAQGQFRQAWQIATEATVDFVQNGREALDDLYLIWDDTAKKIEASATETGKRIAAPVVIAADESEKAADRMSKTVTDMIAALQREEQTLGKTRAEVLDYELSLLGAEQGQRDLVAAIVSRIEAEKESQAAIDRGKQITEQHLTDIERVQIALAELKDLYDAGRISLETYQRATEAAWDSIGKNAEDGVDQFADLKRAIEGWGKDSANAFVDFATTGKGSFRDLINSMIQDMLRMAAYQQIFGPLFGGLSSAMTGGGFSAGVSGAGGFFGGGRAFGGRVSSGGMYEVNELGVPELLNIGNRQFLMMGDQSGSVTPMDQDVGNQTSTSITVNVPAGSPEATRRAAAQGAKQAFEANRRAQRYA